MNEMTTSLQSVGSDGGDVSGREEAPLNGKKSEESRKQPTNKGLTLI